MIKDEFTDLPISRQRKYQLRKAKKGLCGCCGAQKTLAALCDKCFDKTRKALGSVRRYARARRYQV